VESSCELGNEHFGSIKCWELPSGCTSCGLSSGTQLNKVSFSIMLDSLMFCIMLVERRSKGHYGGYSRNLPDTGYIFMF
jgi:hypothetical protein